MNKPKHTPGPWRSIWISNTLAMNNVGHAEVHGPKGIVCNCEESSIEETEANARLIAAAPELLEALQQAITWSDENDINQPYWVQSARMLLAKATGGEK